MRQSRLTASRYHLASLAVLVACVPSQVTSHPLQTRDSQVAADTAPLRENQQIWEAVLRSLAKNNGPTEADFVRKSAEAIGARVDAPSSDRPSVVFVAPARRSSRDSTWLNTLLERGLLT